MAKLDYGFKQSDKMLIDLEKRIKAEYNEAYKEMAEKTADYFARYEKEDKQKAALVKSGAMTRKEYGEWRQRKMLQGERWNDMKLTLAQHATNTDKIARSFISDKVKDAYALNMNYGTYALEKVTGINTGFTLINQDAVRVLLRDNPQLLPLNTKLDIPKDMRWNMEHINHAVTQGILQGESIPKVAKRLQNVTNMDSNAAMRNARTAMNGAQNAGRLDAMKRMANRGIALKKVWIATVDNVTRDSHVDLDGEVQDLDKTFSNGLDYPCGAGEPAEVYNCRCKLGHEYDKYKTDWSNPENRNMTKLDGVSYEEWKKQHRDRLEKKKKKEAAQAVVNKVKDAAKKIVEPIVNSEAYKKIVDKIKGNYRIAYKKVNNLPKELTDTEIIDRIAGGDLTKGSCSSLSYAYIGNRCGYDVLDFRNGDSRKFFATVSNEQLIRNLGGVEKQVFIVDKEAGDIAQKLMELNLPYGKEYRLSCGRHAAIIRNTENGYQYLELQSPVVNGWKSFTEKNSIRLAKDAEGKYYYEWDVTPCTMADTLHNRFGCKTTKSNHAIFRDGALLKDDNGQIIFGSEMELTAVDSYKGNEDFKDILGYINTAPDKQKKGVRGHVR